MLGPAGKSELVKKGKKEKETTKEAQPPAMNKETLELVKAHEKLNEAFKDSADQDTAEYVKDPDLDEIPEIAESQKEKKTEENTNPAAETEEKSKKSVWERMKNLWGGVKISTEYGVQKPVTWAARKTGTGLKWGGAVGGFGAKGLFSAGWQTVKEEAKMLWDKFGGNFLKDFLDGFKRGWRGIMGKEKK